MRGRQEEGAGLHRTLEWIGHNDAGEAIARVVRILGPVWSGWRVYRAVARDDDAKVIELRPGGPPDSGPGGSPCVGGRWWARVRSAAGGARGGGGAGRGLRRQPEGVVAALAIQIRSAVA
jgi:hypothetical protein